ncbi:MULTISPECIES: hypothetical protein [unclassified Pseudoclavibacter]|jgi:uncharacterized membrane protein YhaH (DUF805 family)|uniref:hypothetical protein n=1 Tax=unclassified Pseudoclavibacter TaxID=2615177 RepID=UPI0011B04971|nr:MULTISPECIES: hypothetical protein [unclassified Pseudoclavibacter]NYF13291.1 uncharacterized membrane protein YhaH (DUF805 family) [Pseudoclavibacter sp. JAI123]
MELMFAGLAGILLGVAVQFAAPHRATRGTVLLPALGGIVALVAWQALTWLQGPAPWLAYDGGWIWVITLVVAAVVTIAVGWSLSARRQHDDDDLLHRLSHLGRAQTTTS